MFGTEDLITLAAALHRNGASADRLEESLDRAAERLGMEARFLATPTSIMVATATGTRLLRVEPGEVDLSRLAALEGLITDIGHVPAAGLRARLLAIEAAAAPYGSAATVAGFALASAAAARFLGGGVAEIAAGVVEGLAVGSLALGLRGPAARLFEPVAAFVVTILAILAGRGGAAVDVATVAGLVVLVPGMTLTVAMTELAGRHLVSGAARLLGAGMTFLALGFGVALAMRLGAPWLLTNPPVALPRWTELVALATAVPALIVLLRAPMRDAGAIAVSGLAGYLAARAGAASLGAELGAFTGAIAVAAWAEIWARWTGRSAVVVQVPGLLLLVPGTLGFRSVAALVAEDAFVGVKLAFGMLLVAASIVVGTMIVATLARTFPAAERHERASASRRRPRAPAPVDPLRRHG